MQRRYLGGALFVLGAGLLFGTIATLTNLAGRAGLPSSGFTFLRALVGSAAIVGFQLIRREVRPLTAPRRQLTWLLVAGLANALTNLAIFWAYGLMVVAYAVAIYFSYPVLVLLASVALRRERLTPVRVLGVALNVAGIGLVLSSGTGTAALAPAGVVAALVAAVLQASFLVVSRASYPAVDAEDAIATVLAIGAIVAALVLALSPDGAATVAALGSPSVIAIAVFGGILTAAVAKVWLLRGTRVVGATRAATLMTVEPVTGVLLAAAILGQPLGAGVLVGGALAAAGVVCAQIPAPGRRAPAALADATVISARPVAP